MGTMDLVQSFIYTLESWGVRGLPDSGKVCHLLPHRFLSFSTVSLSVFLSDAIDESDFKYRFHKIGFKKRKREKKEL